MGTVRKLTRVDLMACAGEETLLGKIFCTVKSDKLDSTIYVSFEGKPFKIIVLVITNCAFKRESTEDDQNISILTDGENKYPFKTLKCKILTHPKFSFDN